METGYCVTCDKKLYDCYEVKQHKRFLWHEIYPSQREYLDQTFSTYNGAKRLANNMTSLTGEQWLVCFDPKERRYMSRKESDKHEILKKGFVFYLPSEDVKTLFIYA